MSLSALLLVGGLMFVANSAQAQGNVFQPVNSDVKGASNWKVESVALQVLEAELQGPIAQALNTLPPSGQQYIIWKHKAMLYQGVHSSIEQGVSTSKSVRINYDQLAGAPHMEPIISALTQQEWQVILNDLVTLLTN